MLVEVARDIWIVEGENVRFVGISYPTRMTVVRLRDGGLWIYSPIRSSRELRSELESLGTPRCIVSPNKLHHLFLGEWAESWPEASLYAPPGLAKRRKDLVFHAELGDETDPAWAVDIDQVVFRGSFAMEEVVFFHRHSATLIVADLIQKFDPATLPWPQRMVMKADGLVGKNGSTPREWRLSFWNRAATRKALAKAIAWNPERIVLAHGDWVRAGGREALRASMRWLGP